MSGYEKRGRESNGVMGFYGYGLFSVVFYFFVLIFLIIKKLIEWREREKPKQQQCCRFSQHSLVILDI